jgi:pimeloyl-ACP methyl ester carboxylesterase
MLELDDAATRYETWRAGGRLLPITRGVDEFRIFVRSVGSGPAVTLLHGFPSSSWDWAGVEPLLAADHTVVSVDLIGYGESSKPWPHRYSVAEHAEVISAIWRELGITSTAVVGHDVGSSIAQELLARSAEGRLGVHLSGVVFLNSALIADHYQPARVTRLLARPLWGRVIAGLMNEQRMVASVSSLYSDAGRPSAAHPAEQWRVFQQHGGTRVLPGLTHYLADKKAEGERWRDRMTSSSLPLGIVWGRADTALPEILYDDAVRALPGARAVLLDGVGHFPQVERPDVVAESVRSL